MNIVSSPRPTDPARRGGGTTRRRGRGLLPGVTLAAIGATLTALTVAPAASAAPIPPVPPADSSGPAVLGSAEGLGQNIVGQVTGTGLEPVTLTGAGTGPSKYVALGDSYAAVGQIAPGAWAPGPVGCVRTDDAYPTVVARELGVEEFVNATCGGAVTDDFWAPYRGAPPQFDALTQDTDLVTMSIGGNDSGFGAVIVACALRNNTPDPLLPVVDAVTGSISEGFDPSAGCLDVIDDQASAALTELDSRLDEVYAEIARRSPDAQVVTTGYLAAMPPEDQIITASPSCWPLHAASRAERDRMRDFQNDLNDVVRAAAERNGATVVIPDEPGHSMCAAADTRYVDMLGIDTGAAPVHPTTLGHAHVADRVLAALGA